MAHVGFYDFVSAFFGLDRSFHSIIVWTASTETVAVLKHEQHYMRFVINVDDQLMVRPMADRAEYGHVKSDECRIWARVAADGQTKRSNWGSCCGQPE